MDYIRSKLWDLYSMVVSPFVLNEFWKIRSFNSTQA